MTTEPCSNLPKALVVDDHSISRTHITAALEQIPCNVRQTGTATNALSIARNWRPDIICMDIRLPDGNGLGVVGKIRSEWPEDKTQPEVLILTADESVIDKKVLAELQIARLLVKPVTALQLREAIGHITHGRVCEKSDEGHRQELRKLFRKELEIRLPELDASMLDLDMKKAVTILHQLIASAAICRERSLESDFRALDRACRLPMASAGLGHSYAALLRSARDFQSRNESS